MARRGHGEGSIYQRKDGRWAASITLEGRKRKTFYGKTRKEVQEKLNTALHEQKQGMLVTGPRQTVKQFLTYWIEDVHKQSVRAITYTRYKQYIHLHILPVIGHHQLSKLSPQHIQAFYTKKLNEGLSAKSIALFHAVLHKAFDHAVRLGILPRNICNLVSPPRPEEHEVHPLTLEQIQQLLKSATGHKLEAFFVLALVTGMRRGELRGLKWKDVNVAEGALYIRRSIIEVSGKGIIESEPKTAKGRRRIQLPPIALEALERHRMMQEESRRQAKVWQEHDLIFCTSCGTAFGGSHIQRVFKALLKKAGLPDIRFHDLRHSAATLMLSMGIHPKVVQEVLGHSQIGMTMDIYSHVMPTMQKDAMSKLNDALRNNS